MKALKYFFVTVMFLGCSTAFLPRQAVGAEKREKITPSHAAFNYDWSYPRGGPVDIRPEAVTYLKADMADRSGGVKESRNDTGVRWQGRKRYLRWVIRADKTRSYIVTAVAGPDGGEKFATGEEIAIIGPQNQVTLKCTGRVIAAETLELPSGVSKVEVRVVKEDGRASLFGLELIAEEKYTQWKKRLEKFRSDTNTTWLSKGTYGIRTAPSAYPVVGRAWNLHNINRRFDPVRHADMAEEMGAAWVETIHWAHWRWPAPLKSIDKLRRGFTYKNDILGKIADELHKRDMRWVLYYHPGHSYHYRHQYYGKNRNDWLKNFVRVITEIGGRYGEKLDGLDLDGGNQYYPAPFEILTQAARTGNPGRYVQWRTSGLPPVTPWSSVYDGGRKEFSSSETGEKVRLNEDLFKGVVAAAAWPFEDSGWYIEKESQWIGLPPRRSEWLSKLKKARKHKVALFPALPMYCDGSVSPYSYAVMVHARREFRGVSDRQLLQRRGKRGTTVRLCSLVAPSVLRKDKQEAENQAQLLFRQAGHQLDRNKPGEAANLLLWVVNHYPNTSFATMSLKWLMDHPLEGIPLLGVELPGELADWPQADYSGKLRASEVVPPTAAAVHRRKAQEMYDQALEAEQTDKPDKAADILLDIISKYPGTEHARKARKKILEMYGA